MSQARNSKKIMCRIVIVICLFSFFPKISFAKSVIGIVPGGRSSFTETVLSAIRVPGSETSNELMVLSCLENMIPAIVAMYSIGSSTRVDRLFVDLDAVATQDDILMVSERFNLGIRNIPGILKQLDSAVGLAYRNVWRILDNGIAGIIVNVGFLTKHQKLATYIALTEVIFGSMIWFAQRSYGMREEDLAANFMGFHVILQAVESSICAPEEGMVGKLEIGLPELHQVAVTLQEVLNEEEAVISNFVVTQLQDIVKALCYYWQLLNRAENLPYKRRYLDFLAESLKRVVRIINSMQLETKLNLKEMAINPAGWFALQGDITIPPDAKVVGVKQGG